MGQPVKSFRVFDRYCIDELVAQATPRTQRGVQSADCVFVGRDVLGGGLLAERVM